jgi:hypothetical protein
VKQKFNIIALENCVEARGATAMHIDSSLHIFYDAHFKLMVIRFPKQRLKTAFDAVRQYSISGTKMQW